MGKKVATLEMKNGPEGPAKACAFHLQKTGLVEVYARSCRLSREVVDMDQSYPQQTPKRRDAVPQAARRSSPASASGPVRHLRNRQEG